MERSEMLRQLLPYYKERPYVFISYQSGDQAVAWQDALELQKRGYNVWIDQPNLGDKESTWKNDALRAIRGYNCEILLFYVSRRSLTSANCFEELQTAVSEETKNAHFGEEVGFIAVEAEEIGDIADLYADMRREIERSSLSSEQKAEKSRMMTLFMNSFVNKNNEKTRIRYRLAGDRLTDYYEEIEGQLKKCCRRSVKLSADRLYRDAVECMIREDGHQAETLLRLGAARAVPYVPSALMLSHLYASRYSMFGQDLQKARQGWEIARNREPDWRKAAEREMADKAYTEALAYYLGCGERYGDGESLFRASKIWLRKGSRRQLIATLRYAAEELKYEKARLYLNGIETIPEEELQGLRYTDEKKLAD